MNVSTLQRFHHPKCLIALPAPLPRKELEVYLWLYCSGDIHNPRILRRKRPPVIRCFFVRFFLIFKGRNVNP